MNDSDPDPDPDLDPNRLQELISSNALIASFLGPPVIESDELRGKGGGDDDDDEIGGEEGGRKGTSHKSSSSLSPSAPQDQEEINKMLHSISCSCDIDAIIAGIASDLYYFVKHSPSFFYDSTNDSGRRVQVGDNTTSKNETDKDSNVGGDDETKTSAVQHTSGTTASSTSLRSLSELSDGGVDDSNNPIRPPVPEPVPVPVQLQTLVYRISRLKSLLYNEAPSLLLPSENAASNNSSNNNNNDDAQTANATSFIQHFLPILSSSANGQYDLEDSNFTINSSTNSNTIVSDYQHKQNVKKILRTLLLTKSENSSRNRKGYNHRFIIPTLLQHIHLLPFEIRKNVSSIFNYLLVNTGNSSRSSRQEFVLFVRNFFNIIMDFIVGGHFIHGINIERGKSKNKSNFKKGSTTNTVNVSKQTTNDRSSKERKNSVSEEVGSINDEISERQETGSNSQLQPSEAATPSPTTITTTTTTKTTTTTTTKTNSTDKTPATAKRRLQSFHRTPDVALHCGSMLRSMIRHPILYAKLVSNESNVQKYIFPFLDCFVNQPNFETASDALETLRLILHPTEIDMVLPSCDDDDGDDYYNDYDYDSQSSPKNENNANTTVSPDEVALLSSKDPAEIEAIMETLSSTFLERYYAPIFVQRFNPKLLSSDHANYITRRVSLQLLSSILLTRSNYSIMIKYVSSKSNLRTIMMLLRDSSAHITLEAFNVFKIFVANPNKPPEVIRILVDNKVKLVKYLSGLHKEREDMDEQFRDEKILVISTLEQMESSSE